MRRVRWVLWTAETCVGLVLLAILGGLRLNVSPSVDYGVYWQLWHPPVLTRGQLVTVRLDGMAVPVLKPVVGLTGDVVCREHDQLLIGDLDYGAILPEAPSVLAEGECLTVPAGSVFLASTHPRSYDSRYFGWLAVNQLQGILQPLYTWR